MKYLTKAAWLAVGVLLALPEVGNAFTIGGCNPAMSCCPPSPPPGGGGGPTCGAAQGVASTPSNSSLNVGAGNPINVITGNKYQVETDMPALPGVLGLEIVRHYNSVYSQPGMASGPLGRGWRLSYETELSESDGIVTLTQADRRVITFNATGGRGAPLRPADPSQGFITRELAGSEQVYVWTWTAGADPGRQLRFDPKGRLVQIKASTGEVLEIRRDSAGRLTKVIDPQGRTLEIHSLKGDEPGADKRFTGIQAIDSPLGRYTYEHGSSLPAGSKINPGQLIAVLTSVTLPGKVKRLYHHEDPRYPTLLTGITVIAPPEKAGAAPQAQRISTWAYDALGRANLSVKGEPARMATGSDGKPLQPPQQVRGTGIEQVTLRWPDGEAKDAAQDVRIRKTDLKGAGIKRTILTNSLGQETVYSHTVIAGEPRLLEIRGPGCATCAEPNVRYAYDKQGRLISTTQLDDKGVPFQSTLLDLDDQGRVLEESAVRYVAGKPQRPEWRTRYTYDEQARSITVRKPSVIEGREYTQRIERNAFGQVVKVTESGFSPISERNEPTLQGTPITRTTSYKYDSINGRSVLVEVDGPLPNGPKGAPEDSDITRLQWDERADFIVASTQPLGLTAHFARDVLGRMASTTDAAGVVTRYEYAAPGRLQPTATQRGSRTTRFTFDAQGQVRSVSDAPGRSIALAYDAAGHLVSATDAQGYKAEVNFDTEHLPRVAGLYEPGQAQPLRATYRWFDAQRRITRQLRPDGRIDNWTYDAQGRVSEHLDGDDVMHLSRWNTDIGVRVAIDMAPGGLLRASLQPETPADAARYSPGSRLDDFGRVVVAWLPGQGVRLRQYDAAGRLLQEQRLDARAKPAGSTRYEHDAAGRLVSRATFDAQGTQLHRFARTHAGGRVESEGDDAEFRRYAYDANGRRIQAQITLKDGQGAVVFETTLKSHFDPVSGQLERQTLADGQVMRTLRREDTQDPSAMSLRSAFWSRMSDRLEANMPASVSGWIQRTLPAQDVLARIDVHPFNGITGHAHGNGVKTSKGFDIAGRITTLKVVVADSAITAQTLRYAVGPRIRGIEDTASAIGAPFKVQYDYTGFGALKPDSSAKVMKTALGPAAAAPASAAAIEHDSLGRTASDGTYRYTYTAMGQVASVSTTDDKPIAVYRYNAWNQRISKTLASGQVTYYLWHNGKLVAEIDGAGTHRGQVAAQYLYVSDDSRTAPVAKIEAAFADGNATGSERLLAIHANHRGEPIAMTDETRRVVWKARSDAWGHVPAKGLQQQQATLNIRLPGQYFDAETGLHDNWHRTYDPRPDSPLRGTYLTPDPLGYPDGPDPYIYVNGDPVNRVDPLGLYEMDIHYYMTYFLAITAGVAPDRARTIALAAQYVDNNPATQPVNQNAKGEDELLKSVLTNVDRLKRYHFVLSDQSGFVLPEFRNNRFDTVDSAPQLINLLNASRRAETCAAQDQLFGEYLHAFEDTFAHRDPDNIPIHAMTTLIAAFPNLGGGHGHYMHDPDYTYNHVGFAIKVYCNLPIPSCFGPGFANWKVNESRTLQMEEQVFAKLQAIGDPSKAVSLSKIRAVLTEFNAIREDGHNTGEFGFKGEDGKSIANSKKVQLLNNALRDLGYVGLDLTNAREQGYDVTEAAKNRERNLCDKNGNRFKQADYPGTILPTTSCPQ